jgi:pantoate--beta-alanine ligase
LTAEQRAVAPSIFRALEQTRKAIEGGARNFDQLEQEGLKALQEAGFRPDYFSIRDAATLDRPAADSISLVVLTAARIGRARLIDNVRATMR